MRPVKVRQLGVYPTRIGTNGKSGVGSASRTGNATGKAATGGNASANTVKIKGKKITRVQILLFTREMADLLEAELRLTALFRF